MSRQDSAETIGLQALTWILSQSDEAGAFLNASGANAGDLATLAGNPHFLGAVLDFLLQEDARVIGFCQAQGLPFTAPMQARADLPGGQQMHWT